MFEKEFSEMFQFLRDTLQPAIIIPGTVCTAIGFFLYCGLWLIF